MLVFVLVLAVVFVFVLAVVLVVLVFAKLLASSSKTISDKICLLTSSEKIVVGPGETKANSNRNKGKGGGPPLCNILTDSDAGRSHEP